MGLTLTRDGRQDEELDTRKINKAGLSDTVMQVLHFSVVVKQNIVKKAKLSIFKTVFVPTLNYYNESWAITERVRSQVQAFEMRFL